jgi:hypothetical protein
MDFSCGNQHKGMLVELTGFVCSLLSLGLVSFFARRKAFYLVRSSRFKLGLFDEIYTKPLKKIRAIFVVPFAL